MRIVAGALLMMSAAGCAAVPPAEGAEEEVREAGDSRFTCDAARAQHLVGRQATAELGAEAMRASGAGTLRWISADSMVTMDFRTDRLNIELDARNKVTKIRCG